MAMVMVMLLVVVVVVSVAMVVWNVGKCRSRASCRVEK